MKSAIVEHLQPEFEPVAVVWSESIPEGTVEFKKGCFGCVLNLFAEASRRGRVAGGSRETIVCSGGRAALGFGVDFIVSETELDHYSAIFSKGLESARDEGAYRERMESARSSWRPLYEFGERRHCSFDMARQWIRDCLPRDDASLGDSRTTRLSVTPIRLWAAAAALPIVLATACSPGGSDRSESLVAKLDARIPEVVARGNAPSMQVAVVHGDRRIWSRAFGEDRRVDSVYMNGSVQKVFDSVAVLQLAERGLVDLDADVSTYLPFELRHPVYPNEPVTIRMLLAHRSGLDAANHQFAWDTGSVFSPDYRLACPPDLLEMSLEQFMAASLTPEGLNYDERIWAAEPGSRYHYSLIAFALLRSMVERVTGQSFPDYMQQNLFDRLGMTSSGYSSEPFAARHTVPHTRIDGENIELPVWNGRGYMMHTTAEDQARLMLALMHRGQAADHRLLRPETVELMQIGTSRYKVLFRSSPDLQRTGDAPGLNLFRGGWVGYGGSTPGYQCLWRFHPSKQVGYVILTNVNAILGGGDNYASARSEIYEVQDALLAVLDPTLVVRGRTVELLIVGAIVLVWVAVIVRLRRRARARGGQA